MYVDILSGIAMTILLGDAMELEEIKVQFWLRQELKEC